MKSKPIRLMAVLVLLLLFTTAVSAAPGRPGNPEPPGQLIDLQLLAINDYHGHLEASTPGTIEGAHAGGSEYLSAKLNELRQGKKCSLTVAAGDLIGGSPALTAIIAKWQPLFDAAGNDPVGTITETIFRGGDPPGSDRGVESAAGNLVADAQLWATSSNFADVAFMNPGGVRSDLTYAELGDEGDGVVTYGEAFTFQPFGNTLYTFPMTGAEIVSVLEEQCQPAGSSRPFLHLGVSEGFTYDLSKSIVAGDCTSVTVSNVKLDGVDLNPAALYNVTVNNFLADGGDNFTTFATITAPRLDGGNDLQALINYLGTFSPVAPPSTDRVNEY